MGYTVDKSVTSDTIIAQSVASDTIIARAYSQDTQVSASSGDHLSLAAHHRQGKYIMNRKTVSIKEYSGTLSLCLLNGKNQHPTFVALSSIKC